MPVNTDSSGGYVDLQINGFAGVDFNDPETTPDQLNQAAAQLKLHGVEAALPTIITAAPTAMVQCLAKLAAAIDNDPVVASVFRGIHLEGPFLSQEPGYIGAHPPQYASGCDRSLLERLQAAAGGHLRLVTLAPEVDGNGSLTRFCAKQAILVAAGHTNASLNDLQRGIDNGLKIFTHFGNACPALLPRHDNILLRALSLVDHLHFTLIADGHHVPLVLMQNLLRWIPLSRLAVVSDAISAAGLGPGEYTLGERTVKIGEDKVAWDAAGEHFVGSAASMKDADRWLERQLQLDLQTRQALLRDNPLKWLQGNSFAPQV